MPTCTESRLMFTLYQRHKLHNENPRQIHEHDWGTPRSTASCWKWSPLVGEAWLEFFDKCETGDGCRGLLAFSPAPSMSINVMNWTLRVGNTLCFGLNPLRSKHDATPRTQRSTLLGSRSWTSRSVTPDLWKMWSSENYYMLRQGSCRKSGSW
jgi:hypothetical protein